MDYELFMGNDPYTIFTETAETVVSNFNEAYAMNEDKFKDKNIFEIISLYVSGLYNDILSDIDSKRLEFGIDEGLTDEEAVAEIQKVITEILIESEEE